MGMVAATRDAMLAPVSSANTVSLHIDNPGDTGANEVSSRWYERQPIAWSTPVAGTITSTIPVVFGVPRGTTCTHLGYWNGDTFLGSREFAPVTFTRRGTWTLDIGDVRESVI